MGANRISGMVIGLVLALVGLALYPVYAGATDTLYRQFTARCTLAGGDTTLRVHSSAGTDYAVSASGTSCVARTVTGSLAGASGLTSAAAVGTAILADAGAVSLLSEDNRPIAVTRTVTSPTTIPSSLTSGTQAYTAT